jgi:inner membrane protein
VIGIVAANLPDVDLLYTGVTPEPLGYLLHHRGHTHTLLGLLVQGAALAALAGLRVVRRPLAAAAGPAGVLGLIAAGLLSHLAMDGWNSYGVHPFWPLDNRWYYADAVLIFEPMLWVLLGVCVALNARRRGWRIALVALLVLAHLALTWAGLLAWRSLVLLAVMAGAVIALRPLDPRRRAIAVLGMVAAVVVSLHVLAAQAAARVREQVGRPLADVVVNPNPAAPWCWTTIALEVDGDDLVYRRATVSLMEGAEAVSCPSHRFMGGGLGSGPILEIDVARTSRSELRRLVARDCWVKVWLQFGRSPHLKDGALLDVRFERGGDNFTRLEVEPGRGCPPALTSWTPPRADLLPP